MAGSVVWRAGEHPGNVRTPLLGAWQGAGGRPRPLQVLPAICGETATPFPAMCDDIVCPANVVVVVAVAAAVAAADGVQMCPCQSHWARQLQTDSPTCWLPALPLP